MAIRGGGVGDSCSGAQSRPECAVSGAGGRAGATDNRLDDRDRVVWQPRQRTACGKSVQGALGPKVGWEGRVVSGDSGDGSEGEGERMGATGVGAVEARRRERGQRGCGSRPAHTPTSGGARQRRPHAPNVGPHSCHCRGHVWWGDPLPAGKRGTRRSILAANGASPQSHWRCMSRPDTRRLRRVPAPYQLPSTYESWHPASPKQRTPLFLQTASVPRGLRAPHTRSATGKEAADRCARLATAAAAAPNNNGLPVRLSTRRAPLLSLYSGWCGHPLPAGNPRGKSATTPASVVRPRGRTSAPHPSRGRSTHPPVLVVNCQPPG